MSELQGLEKQLQDAKELVARRDMALKLGQNRDFRKLILEDFVVKEAARLVAQSADPALDPLQRADALGMAQAAGHLKRYLSMMVTMGDTAERDIVQLEAMISDVRTEGDDD